MSRNYKEVQRRLAAADRIQSLTKAWMQAGSLEVRKAVCTALRQYVVFNIYAIPKPIATDPANSSDKPLISADDTANKSAKSASVSNAADEPSKPVIARESTGHASAANAADKPSKPAAKPLTKSEMTDVKTVTASMMKKEFICVVWNQSTLDAYAEAESKFKWDKPLVINFASEYKPGGGWLKGALAQEEQLFYQTTLHASLDQRIYPLGKNQIVYSPTVGVLVDTDYDTIRGKDRFTCSVLSVAAVRKPKLVKMANGYDYYMKEDQAIMEAKINAIFEVAILRGHKSIILGALGCGAFGNPAPVVAKMLAAAIKKFQPFFDGVVFAVLNPKADPASNFSVFHKVLHVDCK